MAKKKRYYRTTISIVVLSDRPIEYDNLEDLSVLLHSFDYPWYLQEPEEEVLTPQEAAEAVNTLEFDPGLLGLTAEGEEL